MRGRRCGPVADMPVLHPCGTGGRYVTPGGGRLTVRKRRARHLHIERPSGAAPRTRRTGPCSGPYPRTLVNDSTNLFLPGVRRSAGAGWTGRPAATRGAGGTRLP
ncbi:DUF6420 family protein [Streptomyces sp. NPDC006334]|uniref:DUF6420 family protein n=1 Tax=Streptomyces sp. NPDC006334 TaxID=3156754 RepID=UPI0033BDD8EF